MVSPVPQPTDEWDEAVPSPSESSRLGMRWWFRIILGCVLILGLLTCVVLGIYRVIEATRAAE